MEGLANFFWTRGKSGDISYAHEIICGYMYVENLDHLTPSQRSRLDGGGSSWRWTAVATAVGVYLLMAVRAREGSLGRYCGGSPQEEEQMAVWNLAPLRARGFSH